MKIDLIIKKREDNGTAIRSYQAYGKVQDSGKLFQAYMNTWSWKWRVESNETLSHGERISIAKSLQKSFDDRKILEEVKS